MHYLWRRTAGRLRGSAPSAVLLLAALMALSACAGATPATVDPRLAATVAVIQTQYVMPVTGSTPAALSTPVPGQAGVQGSASIFPLIIVQDQDISAGQVMVRTVISAGDGWVVIHATDKNGSVGEAIGYAPIKQGTNNNVQVSIDAHKATSVLFAELHTDAGKPGAFEYPGPDQPVTYLGQAVLSAFHTSSASGSAGSTNQLEELNSTATAIAPGGSLSTGSPAVTGQATNNLAPSPTPAVTATPTPFPTPAATSTLPPSVKVSSQPLKNGQVTIAEVISPGLGWIVVYASANGQPGQVLGYAPVHDGVNTNVIISILPLASSRTLIAVLHTDQGKPGVFEFPGPDAPVTRGQQLIWAQFNLLQ